MFSTDYYNLLFADYTFFYVYAVSNLYLAVSSRASLIFMIVMCSMYMRSLLLKINNKNTCMLYCVRSFVRVCVRHYREGSSCHWYVLSSPCPQCAVCCCRVRMYRCDTSPVLGGQGSESSRYSVAQCTCLVRWLLITVMLPSAVKQP